MKRSIVFICTVALLCMVLCGCGSSRDRDMAQQSPSVTIDLIPDVSPVVSMDPDDGYVQDQDGMIEEHDTGSQDAGIAPSASPKVSTSPSASMQPGTGK